MYPFPLVHDLSDFSNSYNSQPYAFSRILPKTTVHTTQLPEMSSLTFWPTLCIQMNVFPHNIIISYHVLV